MSASLRVSHGLPFEPHDILLTGYAFPNALLQHALPDLNKLSIDVAHLQQKRDRLVGTLRNMGYAVHLPEGTFYLFPQSPWEDDWAFAELLAEHNILSLPGSVTEIPGYFRLSLPASDEMIDRALPGFEAALRQARERNREPASVAVATDR